MQRGIANRTIVSLASARNKQPASIAEQNLGRRNAPLLAVHGVLMGILDINTDIHESRIEPREGFTI